LFNLEWIYTFFPPNGLSSDFGVKPNKLWLRFDMQLVRIGHMELACVAHVQITWRWSMRSLGHSSFHITWSWDRCSLRHYVPSYMIRGRLRRSPNNLHNWTKDCAQHDPNNHEEFTMLKVKLMVELKYTEEETHGNLYDQNVIRYIWYYIGPIYINVYKC
jgi:hypothetical protein